MLLADAQGGPGDSGFLTVKRTELTFRCQPLLQQRYQPARSNPGPSVQA